MAGSPFEQEVESDQAPEPVANSKRHHTIVAVIALLAVVAVSIAIQGVNSGWIRIRPESLSAPGQGVLLFACGFVAVLTAAYLRQHFSPLVTIPASAAVSMMLGFLIAPLATAAIGGALGFVVVLIGKHALRVLALTICLGLLTSTSIFAIRLAWTMIPVWHWGILVLVAFLGAAAIFLFFKLDFEPREQPRRTMEKLAMSFYMLLTGFFGWHAEPAFVSATYNWADIVDIRFFDSSWLIKGVPLAYVSISSPNDIQLQHVNEQKSLEGVTFYELDNCGNLEGLETLQLAAYITLSRPSSEQMQIVAEKTPSATQLWIYAPVSSWDDDVKHFQNVGVINVQDAKIDQAFIDQVAQLPRLSELQFVNCQFEVISIPDQLKKRTTSLGLYDCGFTEEVGLQLLAFNRVADLHYSNRNGVSKAELTAMINNPRLTQTVLNFDKVDNDNVALISQLKNQVANFDFECDCEASGECECKAKIEAYEQQATKQRPAE